MQLTKDTIHDIFRNQEDAQERCNRTILKTATGNNVRALIYENGWKFRGFDLKRKKTLANAFDIWEMDLSCPPTGFVNTQKGVIYVKRRPYRQWKIGLSPNNVHIDYYNENPNVNDYDFLITECDLADAMLNKFPSFDQAMEDMKKANGRALSMHLALIKNIETGFIELKNMSSVVGFIDFKNDIQLNPVADTMRMQKYLRERHGVPL